ncbi:MAG: sigma-70 family RNA polymerase sigma factor [Planctomycetota bacterium]
MTTVPSSAHVRSDADDAELVARLRRQDEAAYALVLEEHGPRLLATARRLLRNEEDAQDAVQEAFLAAFRSIDSFQGDARLSTWLHRIVINAALMRRRTLGRRREGELQDDGDLGELLPGFNDAGQFERAPVAWTEPSDVEAQRAETRALVRQAIDDLPESYRTALILRDIEELETDEVARHLGVTSNAAKIRVHRARQALRTLLDRRFDPKDGGLVE